jgi:hypothetical protein
MTAVIAIEGWRSQALSALLLRLGPALQLAAERVPLCARSNSGAAL